MHTPTINDKRSPRTQEINGTAERRRTAEIKARQDAAAIKSQGTIEPGPIASAEPPAPADIEATNNGIIYPESW